MAQTKKHNKALVRTFTTLRFVHAAQLGRYVAPHMMRRVLIAVLLLGLFPWHAQATTARNALVYPDGAIKECIEGYVVLEFSVSETGEVSNIVVLDSNPPGVFEAAAIEQLQLMEFPPRMVDGIVVSVLQMQHRFTFEFDDEAYIHCHAT